MTVQATESDPLAAKSAQPLPAARLSDHRGFLAIWLGQFLSAIGTQTTAFALSIWVFQGTSSVGKLGMVVAAQMLPTILLVSLAGVVADRFDRRRIMIFCKLASSCVALATLLLINAGALAPTSVGVMVAVAASFAIFHQIAYAASVPMLVPRALYQRANGMIQLSIHVSAVVVPMVAVLILGAVGIQRVLWIEIVCALLAAITLMTTRFVAADGARLAPADEEERKGLFAAQGDGLRYLFGRRELFVLMLYLTFTSFMNGFVYVLFRPLVLILSDAHMLGTLVTIAGVGGLIGAVLAGFTARFRDRIAVLLWFSIFTGGSMLLAGLSTSIPLIGLAAFGFSFSIPIAVVAVQTLLQTLVPNALHGRVFAARSLMASGAFLLAVVVSPFLAEEVFEPGLLAGGAFASSLGSMFGVGPGRGIAALFVFAGVAMVLMTAVVARQGLLRVMRRDALAAEYRHE